MDREAKLLDHLEEHARWVISGGVVWGVAGVLLFAGLSTSAVGVVVSAVMMIGVAVASMWADAKGRRGRRQIAIFLLVMALFLIAKPLAHRSSIEQLGLALGWCGVLFFPIAMWGGRSLFRLASAARKALDEPTVEARLEIMVSNTGYGGMPHESAMLLPAEPTGFAALATFGTFYAMPWLTAVDGVPATVHGKPLKRGVVVVSCPECALVGRIQRSNFGKVPRPESPLMAFLLKRRTLRPH
jgi:drug/metabolite transporter (DMT)-like permease